MSAKFKSTKKKPELEAEIDDWDVSEGEEGSSVPSQQQQQQQQHRKVYQDAWGDDLTERPKVQGRTLWEEANRQTPQAQPIVQNRTLPASLLAPALSNTSSGRSNGNANGDEYDSRPPPQILRRDRSAEQAAEQAAAIAAANAAKQKKSLAEREEEYKRARERIFGTGNKTASPSQSRNGSGSDTGGRNSPNIHMKDKKVR